MSKYIARRVAVSIITFFGITIFVFFIANMAPGSPLDALLAEPGMTEADAARRAAALGIDKPIYIQYFNWVKALLHGDLGFSYRTFQKVTLMVAQRIGPTLLLTGSAILISYIFAIPLGIISSLRPYSLQDYMSTALAFLTAASPSFFLGMIFIYIFAVKLGWFPMGGMYESGVAGNFLSLLRHLVLPAVALALPQIGSTMRYVRSSMLEVLNEDYIRTAKAKGLRPKRVIWVHAFRNALIPVVTNFGSSLPFLIGGAVVTEQVFSWSGLGMLMVSSIGARDYPVIMGITVVVAIFVLIGNLIVDLLYGVLDPRIRYN
ncbi:ABC transporter permease [Tepidanaerobacter syntrophicus]|uniref:Peptide/nickel transport system permease protein n=1 Tax=Tepidanaerobacter syntrophicus TaxID=224999 RepID=A0A0U9I3L8_9FIRM|nr:ABC transporter permease [Tepidanaerobacter syntrophicus]GAQ24728.1 peptide/nickel transport system permease protein [Tepidanaerobacter syntrophicus]GLI19003.1 peptide ABC transporter permease [Tepidanaerobacter syntrophicus]